MVLVCSLMMLILMLSLLPACLQRLYEEGLVLAKNGQLQAAYFKFKEVENYVPLKVRFHCIVILSAAHSADAIVSEVWHQQSTHDVVMVANVCVYLCVCVCVCLLQSKFGGLAGLQAAIILDSQGGDYVEQAKKMYKALQGHAVTSVSRKAKQMLFGFQAAQFLKVCGRRSVLHPSESQRPCPALHEHSLPTRAQQG